MKATHTYLHFDGNCRDAMTFYAKCLGTQLDLVPFSEGAPDRILHASVGSDPLTIMAADIKPGEPFRQGNNFSISLACESLEEMERLFAAFGKGGTVTEAIHDSFWGAKFGMLTDRFGVSWMFSFR